MIENNIQVKIDRFDGPLALLLHLIQREEMNIKELDITSITKQYLDYLKIMKDLNFDIAGEYLYMAATLLFLKSKYCVNEEEEAKALLNDENIEISSKTDLIKRLEELERYKNLGEKLWAQNKLGHEIFVKPKVNRKAIVNTILAPMDLESLTNSMIDLLRRERRKYTVVKRDKLSIKEKLVSLKNNLKVGQKTEFIKLINTEKGIGDIVITFISLLELSRLKKIQVFQNEDKGAIYVEVVDSLDNFDVDTANGFEPEGEDPDAINAELEKIASNGVETLEQLETEIDKEEANEKPHTLQ